MSQKTLAARRRTKKVETNQTLHAITAVKYAAILTLRNQGWGESRLRRFNKEFNHILLDVSEGYLTLTDIADTIYDETGLSIKDLRVE